MTYPTRLSLNRIVQGQNPRQYFDDAAHHEMVASIKAQGVLQPILLRPHPTNDGIFEIVAGERRWRGATEALGAEAEIDVLIKDLTDAEVAEAALTENVIRKDMNPAEEAEAAARMLAECANDKTETAARLGWSPATLERRLALMNAATDVRQALITKKIDLGHAELLAAVEKSKQSAILSQLLATQPMPKPAQLKEMLASVARSLATACFDMTDCAKCSHNSDQQIAMFSEAIASGNCTKPDCFTAKTEAKIECIRFELVDTWPRVEILRPGSNFTTIKLVVEGPNGVGQDQAAACRQCKNFGAGISAVPGKEGKVFEEFCFDTPCNTRMVAKQIRALTPPTAPSTATNKASTTAAKTDKSKPATSTSISASVNEFRHKLWRKALAAEVVLNTERSLGFLITLALCGSIGKVNKPEFSTKVSDAYEAANLAKPGALTFGETLSLVFAAPRETMAIVALKLSPAACADMAITDVQAGLRYLNVDMTKHFVLNAAYLELLTKTEIQAVAIEVGLDKAHQEKQFKALFSEKKPDLIKKILDVRFDFAVVPKAIHFETAEKA